MTNEDKLEGCVTDGDIRRAFLNGFSMDTPVGEIATKAPIVAPESMSDENMAELIRVNNVYNLPVIDGNGKVIYVKKLELCDLETDEKICAVIMAGGEGLRLRPLTEHVPKPMLKVGDKPILQIIVESLRNSGIKKLLINIRYLGEIIKDYFKDGYDFGVEIDYIHEPKPMGTAGSLGLISDELRPTAPFLVVNGDLLTTLNFRLFRDFHISAGYDFTLCGRPYKVQIPFGYPVIEGDVVTEFREKPVFTHLVNSGIYCISPDLIEKVPVNEYSDMPNLIKVAINDNRKIGVFPLREEFHEIGRPESYEAAEKFYKSHFCQ
jgi:NDP-sugar pyrophosphorylase family protein